MTWTQDGLGRTIGYTALAGLVFLALVIVTPKMVSSSPSASPPLEAVVAGTSITQATTTFPEPSNVGSGSTPPVTPPPVDTTTTTVAPTTTTTSTTIPAAVTTTTQSLEDADRHDGTVQLWVSQRFDPTVDDSALLTDMETVEWFMRVSNTSDGTLYGVFVYLELHGQVQCEQRRLAPGETMSCSATTTVYEGTHVAEIWVDAWTDDRLVQDEQFYRYVVS